MKPKD